MHYLARLRKGAAMPRWSWLFALVTLLGGTGAARAETVRFPAFVSGSGETSTVAVPQCEVAGRRMNCRFAVTQIVLHGGAPGQCFVNIASYDVVFRREDASAWIGDVTVAYCRSRTTYRLSQSAATPRRIVLRLSYDIGDRSEACVKSFEEAWRGHKERALEFVWSEGDPGTPRAIPMPACKSFVTGAGRFPAGAFPR